MQKKRLISAALARFDSEAAAKFRAGCANTPERLLIAGIDEAGRGPLAGPVVAAAVVLPEGSEQIEGVNDSKQLTEKQREALLAEIHQRAVAVGVGIVDAETIDQINILEATRLAACQALKSVRANGVTPDLLLLDALKLSGEAAAQQSIIKGDAQSQAIAAASIVAKVTRDRLMVRYDSEYPEYGFASHKGYGCAGHVRVLNEVGPSTLHRLSFAGVCFFSSVCRQSLTYQRLMEVFSSVSPTEIASTITAYEGFLPAREIRELRRHYVSLFG